MQLGPFETKIGYMESDIHGVESLDIYPELQDDLIKLYRLDLDADIPATGERAQTDANLKLKWVANVELNAAGIDGIYAKITGLIGTIEIEDLPYNADPRDPSIEMETFEYEVVITEQDILDGKWKVTIDYTDNTMLNEVKEPINIVIDFKGKTLTVDF